LFYNFEYVLQDLRFSVLTMFRKLATFREFDEGGFAVGLAIREATVVLNHLRRHPDEILYLQGRVAALTELDDAGRPQPVQRRSGKLGDEFAGLLKMLTQQFRAVLLAVGLAQVWADVAGLYFPTRYFGYKGRLDRHPYFAHALSVFDLRDAVAALIDEARA
jgi:hypothetical protein